VQQEQGGRVFRAGLSVKDGEPIDLGRTIKSRMFPSLVLSSAWASDGRTPVFPELTNVGEAFVRNHAQTIGQSATSIPSGTVALWTQSRVMTLRCCIGFAYWEPGRWSRCRSCSSFDPTRPQAGFSRLTGRWLPRSVSPIPTPARSPLNIVARGPEPLQARVGLTAERITQGKRRPYCSKPKGSSTEWAGWVNQRAPVSVMTMWSSSRTPNSP
jgi:hypothetical protein